MKPFNLEEARAGKAVCTRDGRDVTILKFDLNQDPDELGERSLVIIIHQKNGYETPRIAKSSGMDEPLLKASDDLFMKSTTEKRWAVYYEEDEDTLGYLSTPYKRNEIPKRLASICNGQSHKSAQVVEFEIEV